jgi:lantibiotic modifying enzyme
VEDDPAFRGEIECAIAFLQTSPAKPADHLCCGEFGNLELFLEAGRRLNRPDWIALARQRGAACIARSERVEDGHRSGFHSNLGACELTFMPGLFNGLSGIGYQMLRLAAPQVAPSVLLWD